MTLLEAFPQILKGREWKFKDETRNTGGWYVKDVSISLEELCEQVILKPRLVRKEVKVWVNVYNDGYNVYHGSESAAIDGRAKQGSFVTTVECTGFYEVEET